MKSNSKSTGEKLPNLEKLDSIQGLYQVIQNNQPWNAESLTALKLIQETLKKKTQDSDSPLSNASYSAIQLYLHDGNLKIHTGANIDPSSYELFKSPKHRNCAEKQAALSATIKDDLTNAAMQIMFLYRKQEAGRQFLAEKLLPCKDCYETYIQDLIDNNGHLVLIIDDNKPRKFFKHAHFDNNIQSVEVDGQIINYKIFNAKEMLHLNIENVLGGRVCAEGHSHT